MASTSFAELRRRGVVCGDIAESECEVEFVIGTTGAPLPIEFQYISSFDGVVRRYSDLKLFLKRFPKSKPAVVVSRADVKDGKIGVAPVHCVPLWKFLSDADAYLTLRESG